MIGIFLVILFSILLAGTLLLISGAAGSLESRILGVIELPLAIYLLFDAFSYMYVIIIITPQTVVLKRFLRKTVIIDNSEIKYFTNITSFDSGRHQNSRLLTIYTADKKYKYKYSSSLVKSSEDLNKFLRMVAPQIQADNPSLAERFYL